MPSPAGAGTSLDAEFPLADKEKAVTARVSIAGPPSTGLPSAL